MALLAAAAAALATASASLQGLYAVSAGEGQLLFIDPDAGTVTHVGQPLSKSGLQVAACAPALVQQTNKWYFTLATNTTAPDDVHLVGMDLADGSIVDFKTLPSNIFPQTLGMCDYTLDVDGGLVVFVTAVVDDRLVTLRVEPKGETAQRVRKVPQYGINASVVLNVSVPDLDLGSTVQFPSSTILPSGDLWYQLENGVVGHNVVSGKYLNHLKFDGDSTIFSGLAFSQSSSHVHGILQTRSSGASATEQTSVVAQFDPVSNAPQLQTGNASVPAVERDGSATALMADHAQIAVVSGSKLLVLDLNNGDQLESTSICKGKLCPSSIGYLPYVF